MRIEDKKINKSGKKNVKTRLRKGYLIILAFMIGAVAISIAAMTVISINYQNAINNYGFSQGYAGRLGIEFNAMILDVRNLILETDKSEITEIETRLDEQAVKVNDYISQVENTANTDEEYKLLAELESSIEEYNEIKKNVIDLAENNKNDEAYNLLKTKGITPANVVRDNIDAILNLNIEKCNTTMSTSNTLFIALTLLIVALTSASVIIGLRMSTKLSESICNPLVEVMKATDKLKEGNLDIVIDHHSDDELGAMAASFREACTFMHNVIKDTNNILHQISLGNLCINTQQADSYKGEFSTMLANMLELKSQMNLSLLNIHNASEQVSAGAGQLAESAQNLSEGASTQAASVEELMATIQNVSNMVEISASGAENSYQKALEYEQEATKSSEAMNELTIAMEKIHQVSQEIGKIITEIEDIASQTNLLSLNASIEAARAGEAGRGFAVVADQIGKLAADSARSAVNTRELISNAISEIEHGNQITQQTSGALEKVVKGIELLEKNAKDTSHSAQIQSDSIKQIAQGMEEISAVVQGNSAVAEETSATSEELLAQAVTMNNEVKMFQLETEIYS